MDPLVKCAFEKFEQELQKQGGDKLKRAFEELKALVKEQERLNHVHRANMIAMSKLAEINGATQAETMQSSLYKQGDVEKLLTEQRPQKKQKKNKQPRA